MKHWVYTLYNTVWRIFISEPGPKESISVDCCYQAYDINIETISQNSNIIIRSKRIKVFMDVHLWSCYTEEKWNLFVFLIKYLTFVPWHCSSHQLGLLVVLLAIYRWLHNWHWWESKITSQIMSMWTVYSRTYSNLLIKIYL